MCGSFFCCCSGQRWQYMKGSTCTSLRINPPKKNKVWILSSKAETLWISEPSMGHFVHYKKTQTNQSSFQFTLVCTWKKIFCLYKVNLSMATILGHMKAPPKKKTSKQRHHPATTAARWVASSTKVANGQGLFQAGPWRSEEKHEGCAGQLAPFYRK